MTISIFVDRDADKIQVENILSTLEVTENINEIKFISKEKKAMFKII